MRLQITRHFIIMDADGELLASPTVSINFDKVEDASTVKLEEVSNWLEEKISADFSNYRDATSEDMEEFEK